MDEILYEDSPLLSGLFPVHGFGKLHVLAHSGYLGVGESLEINIYGLILDSSQTIRYQIPVYTFVFNSSLNYLYVTIPVPSESFRFSANVNSATGCELSLSFYLTWG